jgi:hypothetical protein
MRLIVGCPVANRAWALPHWFQCLANQTRQPDGFVFLHSGHIGDDTWRAIQDGCERHHFDSHVQHDERAPHARHDNDRFATLADLRNQVLALARGDMHADLFLSLDTDVMLEDPHTIERLLGMLGHGCDLASCATFLHHAASNPNVDHEIFWAYNAGWLNPPGAKGFRRPLPGELDWDAVYRIDIPMAVWLGERAVLDCRYDWHESGEDIAFAWALQDAGLKCHWDTGLRAKHYWQESHLKVAVS